jgi:hypothetical protein
MTMRPSVRLQVNRQIPTGLRFKGLLPGFAHLLVLPVLQPGNRSRACTKMSSDEHQIRQVLISGTGLDTRRIRFAASS